MTGPADLLIVGTGLIGTSVGLAVRPDWEVLLADPDPGALQTAVRRGAGRPRREGESARLALVCVPPGSTAAVIAGLQRAAAARSYSHVCSVQSGVQAELLARSPDPRAVCGSHPMAGREQSGPAAAVAGLFAGRPWVLCPEPDTWEQAVTDVRELVEAVGAQPVVLPATEHDAAVALVSHLPQVAASALAAQLRSATAGPALALAGPGLQDSTRIAGSDPRLWSDVLRRNAANLAPLVAALAQELAAAAQELAVLAAEPAERDPGPGAEPAGRAAAGLQDLLRRGVLGRELVPVKRGERDAAFVAVAVAVPDRPGQIAGLLTAAAAGGVNVEDVHVDHVPGRPQGVVELVVRVEARQQAEGVLREAGWDVLAHS